MKNKIKKALSLILLLVMVLSLFGCGKEDNIIDETDGTSENNEIVGTTQETNSPYAEDQVLFVAQNRYDLEEDSHILHFYNYNGVHLETLDTSFSPVISLKNYAKNGLTPAMDTSNGKYGFINKDGSFEIDAKYDEAYSFSDDGLALVMCEEKYGDAYNNIEKYGFIDSKGNEIIPCIYDCATSFYPCGYAIVGNCDFQIIEAEEFYESDYVESSNYRYGVIDKKGNLIIEQKYQFIDHISGGYILCRNEFKYDIYDYSGSLVYEYVVENSEGFRGIYTSGDYVCASYYDDETLFIFDGNSFVDNTNGNGVVIEETSASEYKKGYSKNNEIVIPCEYDYIYSVKDYFVAVKFSTARGKIDIYNSDFEKTAEGLDYIYDGQVQDFGKRAELPNGYFYVSVGNDKYGIIDYTGKIIVEPIYENVGINTYNSTGMFSIKQL